MRNRLAFAVAVALGALLGPGCISMRVGGGDEFFRMKGLANAYATLTEVKEGPLLDFGLFTNTRGGEIVSLELGPLAGVGIALLGARARVLPFEVGAGVLFYDPRPQPKKRTERTDETDEGERIDEPDDVERPGGVEEGEGKKEAPPAPAKRPVTVTLL